MHHSFPLFPSLFTENLISIEHITILSFLARKQSKRISNTKPNVSSGEDQVTYSADCLLPLQDHSLDSVAFLLFFYPRPQMLWEVSSLCQWCLWVLVPFSSCIFKPHGFHCCNPWMCHSILLLQTQPTSLYKSHCTKFFSVNSLNASCFLMRIWLIDQI